MSDIKKTSDFVGDVSIAVIVVWFHPTFSEVENIKTYLDYVETVYIIDNSSSDNKELLNNIPNIKKINYIPRMDNFGIADALNYGCRLAIESGYEWVMTMDQDSHFSSESISTYISRFNSDIGKYNSIAIYAPVSNFDQSEGFSQRVITSGNLLLLDAYTKVGGFDNELFIDEVDHDFCFNLTRNKYKIYVYGNVNMEHSLGNTKLHTYFFNKEMWVMHHSSIRKYYMIRNRLRVAAKYPEFTKDYSGDNKRLILGVFLFEKNKISKIYHIIRGYLDYKRGVFGRLHGNPPNYGIPQKNRCVHK